MAVLLGIGNMLRAAAAVFKDQFGQEAKKQGGPFKICLRVPPHLIVI
jgi:hypothetical protein